MHASNRFSAIRIFAFSTAMSLGPERGDWKRNFAGLYWLWTVRITGMAAVCGGNNQARGDTN